MDEILSKITDKAPWTAAGTGPVPWEPTFSSMLVAALLYVVSERHRSFALDLVYKVAKGLPNGALEQLFRAHGFCILATGFATATAFVEFLFGGFFSNVASHRLSTLEVRIVMSAPYLEC